MPTKNRVVKEAFTYHETVKEFTGLVFHCPTCDEVMHLHIATVRLEKKKRRKK